MADLLGFTTILLISLMTYILSIRYPEISKILFWALIVRIIVLLMGHYIVTLPDSTADAESFEGYAWDLAENGFSNLLTNFLGPNPYFISWFIGIFYSLFGRSMLMAQSFTLIFGMGSLFLGWLLAKKLWNNRVANKVGWTIAFFPSLILYSFLIMREAYICFFILLALYGVVNWVKTDKFFYIILATVGFISATFFHGAMIVGMIVFAIIFGIICLLRLLNSLIKYRINLKIFTFLLLFLTVSGYYMSNKIYVPYIGTFEKGTNIDVLLQKTSQSTAGEASWPKWTIAKTPFELLYKAPIRSLYVVFAPFPWDVKKTKHLIGMLDSFLYIYLTFLILTNIKVIWRDPAIRFILIILISYIFVFGIGVGNFGTGIRHRSKFVIIFILLAAPMLKRLIFFKKTDKT
jgi:4-amino-4-deoxy-L-arabinose transferase-like glycosyltransferase